MKIKSLTIINYRTIESIDLTFPSSYAAICGPNDCGKTNVVRAIRALAREDSPTKIFEIDSGEQISVKDDYPKWKETKASQREIQFLATLSIQSERDAGLFQFLSKQLSIDKPESRSELEIDIALTYRADSSEPDIKV